MANICKLLKQIVEKAEETARAITSKRRSTTFNLADTKAVVSLIISLKRLICEEFKSHIYLLRLHALTIN